MNKKQEETLFELFKNKKSDFCFYKELIKFIEEVIYQTKGETSAKYYGVLTNLLNSINNAGHEDRRSKDIDYIRAESQQIANNYEDFLS